MNQRPARTTPAGVTTAAATTVAISQSSRPRRTARRSTSDSQGTRAACGMGDVAPTRVPHQKPETVNCGRDRPRPANRRTRLDVMISVRSSGRIVASSGAETPAGGEHRPPGRARTARPGAAEPKPSPRRRRPTSSFTRTATSSQSSPAARPASDTVPFSRSSRPPPGRHGVVPRSAGVTASASAVAKPAQRGAAPAVAHRGEEPTLEQLLTALLRPRAPGRAAGRGWGRWRAPSRRRGGPGPGCDARDGPRCPRRGRPWCAHPSAAERGGTARRWRARGWRRTCRVVPGPALDVHHPEESRQVDTVHVHRGDLALGDRLGDAAGREQGHPHPRRHRGDDGAHAGELDAQVELGERDAEPLLDQRPASRAGSRRSAAPRAAPRG